MNAFSLQALSNTYNTEYKVQRKYMFFSLPNMLGASSKLDITNTNSRQHRLYNCAAFIWPAVITDYPHLLSYRKLAPLLNTKTSPPNTTYAQMPTALDLHSSSNSIHTIARLG